MNQDGCERGQGKKRSHKLFQLVRCAVLFLWSLQEFSASLFFTPHSSIFQNSNIHYTSQWGIFSVEQTKKISFPVSKLFFCVFLFFILQFSSVSSASIFRATSACGCDAFGFQLETTWSTRRENHFQFSKMNFIHVESFFGFPGSVAEMRCVAKLFEITSLWLRQILSFFAHFWCSFVQVKCFVWFVQKFKNNFVHVFWATTLFEQRNETRCGYVTSIQTRLMVN